MFDFAKLAINQYGLISKTGGWFTLTDPLTGEVMEEDGKIIKVNGLAKVYQYLQEHAGYYDTIRKFILDDIAGNHRASLDDCSKED